MRFERRALQIVNLVVPNRFDVYRDCSGNYGVRCLRDDTRACTILPPKTTERTNDLATANYILDWLQQEHGETANVDVLRIEAGKKAAAFQTEQEVQAKATALSWLQERLSPEVRKALQMHMKA